MKDNSDTTNVYTPVLYNGHKELLSREVECDDIAFNLSCSVFTVATLQ